VVSVLVLEAMVEDHHLVAVFQLVDSVVALEVLYQWVAVSAVWLLMAVVSAADLVLHHPSEADSVVDSQVSVL
jgi:hypothetical protein